MLLGTTCSNTRTQVSIKTRDDSYVKCRFVKRDRLFYPTSQANSFAALNSDACKTAWKVRLTANFVRLELQTY